MHKLIYYVDLHNWYTCMPFRKKYAYIKDSHNYPGSPGTSIQHMFPVKTRRLWLSIKFRCICQLNWDVKLLLSHMKFKSIYPLVNLSSHHCKYWSKSKEEFEMWMNSCYYMGGGGVWISCAKHLDAIETKDALNPMCLCVTNNSRQRAIQGIVLATDMLSLFYLWTIILLYQWIEKKPKI